MKRRDPEVSCIVPWLGLNNLPNGCVRPCCGWNGAAGSLRSSTIAELRDGEELRRLRRAILAGMPSEGCQACYRQEESGGRSLRQWFNERFAARLGEAKDDQAAQLRFLSLAFSNVCNFRCRTCTPSFSTGWYSDAIRLNGTTRSAAPPPFVPIASGAGLLEQLEPHLDGLEAIHFQGGEPLLAPEHHQLLERLIQRKLSGIALIYSTNFSVLDHNGRSITALWDRFERVEVAASLDAWGRKAEYLRKGQVWRDVLKNRERLRRDCPRAIFSISPTVSVFNVLDFPGFIDRCIETGLVSADRVITTLVEAPAKFSIQVLPVSFKRRAMDAYENKLAGGSLAGWGSGGLRIAQAYRSIIERLASADLSCLLGDLRLAVEAVDSIRGEKLFSTFPELSGLFDEAA